MIIELKGSNYTKLSFLNKNVVGVGIKIPTTFGFTTILFGNQIKNKYE